MTTDLCLYVHKVKTESEALKNWYDPNNIWCRNPNSWSSVHISLKVAAVYGSYTLTLINLMLTHLSDFVHITLITFGSW